MRRCGPSRLLPGGVVIPSDLDGLHCGFQNAVKYMVQWGQVIPSDLDGLHCGERTLARYGATAFGSSRPIWTGSIAAVLTDEQLADYRESARPIWTGSIAACSGANSASCRSWPVIPSDLDGLHCGG